jgi:hypothetical protein
MKGSASRIELNRASCLVTTLAGRGVAGPGVVLVDAEGNVGPLPVDEGGATA